MQYDFEKFNTCCYKALKHNEEVCPVCGTRVIPQQVVRTANGLKATLLIPLFAFTLNSCERDYYEVGIVKDKIENKVYLTPIDDTTDVYRIINCDTAHISQGEILNFIEV